MVLCFLFFFFFLYICHVLFLSSSFLLSLFSYSSQTLPPVFRFEYPDIYRLSLLAFVCGVPPLLLGNRHSIWLSFLQQNLSAKIVSSLLDLAFKIQRLAGILALSD